MANAHTYTYIYVCVVGGFQVRWGNLTFSWIHVQTISRLVLKSTSHHCDVTRFSHKHDVIGSF